MIRNKKNNNPTNLDINFEIIIVIIVEIHTHTNIFCIFHEIIKQILHVCNGLYSIYSSFQN